MSGLCENYSPQTLKHRQTYIPCVWTFYQKIWFLKLKLEPEDMIVLQQKTDNLKY